MKNRIKNLVIVSALLAGTGSFASDDFAKDRYKNGYTYFATLTTNMNYTSSYTSSGGANLEAGDKIETDATSQNPVYVTGGLYPVNDTFDISTEISTTLVPQRASETWKLNGEEIMTNNSDMLSNNIQVLGHYKFTNEHRALFGGTYNFSSYKRYKFKQGDVDLNLGVTEQRSTSVALQTGYWYEGYYMDDSALHVNFRAIVGYGAYVHTENTDSDATFDNTGGYNLDMYMSVGYRILENSEVGVLAGYSLQDRVGDSASNPDDDTTKVHLPDNTTTNMYVGVYLSF